MPENRVVMCCSPAAASSSDGPGRVARKARSGVPRLAPVVGGLVASLLPAAASAQTCEATQVEADPSLPAVWRRQLEILGERTKRSGAPWACHGGRVRLEPAPGTDGRRLVVTDAEGNQKAQDVQVPDDVVPFGEALLARPLDGEPADGGTAPRPPVADGAAQAKPAPKAAPSVKRENPPRDIPRNPEENDVTTADDHSFVIGVTVGPRLVVPLDDLALSARVHALGSVGALVVGGWGRVDGPSWTLDGEASEVSTLAIGPALGVRVPVGGPELRFTLEPSLAVVIDQAGDGDPEADARIGVGADATFPLGKHLRFAAGVDGELAPARLDEGNGRGRGNGDGNGNDQGDGNGRGANDPDMPAASIGLRFGLEVLP